MASPSFFIKSLIRVANAQGRGVLEAIVTGQFDVLKNTGGKQLTGATAGGKSFTYQIPQGLEVNELMAKAEEALEFFDSCDAEQIANYLKRRPDSRTVARFC